MNKVLMTTLLLSFSAMAKLPKINLDLTNTTVSGLSSGGYMANQFHVAHSDWVKGAGIIAAGPYYCAKNNLLTAFADCLGKRDNQRKLIQTEKLVQWAADGIIADPAHLRSGRVWLLSGTLDNTVVTKVTDALFLQYQQLTSNGEVKYINDKPFAHHFPTESYGTSCDESSSPFIGHCGFDAAGNMLNHLLGKLKPKSKTSAGKLFTLNQQQGYQHGNQQQIAKSLAKQGYVYVPDNCQRGESCRLHISFHGCNQYAGAVDKAYVENTGINAWADTNRLVVLYPQVRKSATNPQGCWDWWGYTDQHYATRKGQQIQAIANIAKHLAGKSE